MAKRETWFNGPAPEQGPSETLSGLRPLLTKRKKEELVEALMELAQADPGVLRRLTSRFDASMSSAKLVAATRKAIADATTFDERRINTNFEYDYEAYEEVQRNLGRLVGEGQLRLAMELSLELMTRGSAQVEMSDEGDMTTDIEDCLKVVFDALKSSELPAEEVLAWCSAMSENDRVGFIAETSLQTLQTRLRKLTK
ncbi:hypothetical protein ACYOEI_18310 [Singulisphaera rosea]